MIALAFLRAHWPVVAALMLGVLIGWLLFHPRAAALHQVIDDHAVASAIAKVDKDTASETTKDSGPTRKIVLEFDPHCPPAAPVRIVPGAPLPPQLIRETIIETGPTQVITRAATEVHAEEQQHVDDQRHLELTVSPASLPGWALQLGLEDALRARSIRIAARRRIFGPFWVELSAVPIQRSIGVAASIDW